MADRLVLWPKEFVNRQYDWERDLPTCSVHPGGNDGGPTRTWLGMGAAIVAVDQKERGKLSQRAERRDKLLRHASAVKLDTKSQSCITYNRIYGLGW